MFRRLARRSPIMPSLQSMSREIGSIPFCVMTTKPLSLPSHTCFLSAITLRTVSSVYARSAATIFSRCSASVYMNVEFTSDRSYSRLMLHVNTNASSTYLFISGCLAPWSRTKP